MIEIAAENAAHYLGHACKVSELGGGVSNTVLLVECDSGRFVLKQSLARLRVEQDWFSTRERIFREADALRMLAPLLPSGALPEVLDEDRGNFIFRMTAAPECALMWKTLLFRGEISIETAETIGTMLGRVIAGTWKSGAFAARFHDRTVFDELRLDPYYRAVARRHPDLASRIDALLSRTLERQVAIVHGDWSPKNFLVSGARVMAIDFEVVHFGDPSFDAAFLLNHLLLKMFRIPQWREGLATAALRFWETLRHHVPGEADWFEPSTLEHLGALLLARIDGKSPVEYINEPELRDRIRQHARALIMHPPERVADVFA